MSVIYASILLISPSDAAMAQSLNHSSTRNLKRYLDRNEVYIHKSWISASLLPSKILIDDFIHAISISALTHVFALNTHHVKKSEAVCL